MLLSAKLYNGQSDGFIDAGSQWSHGPSGLVYHVLKSSTWKSLSPSSDGPMKASPYVTQVFTFSDPDIRTTQVANDPEFIVWVYALV